MWNDPWTRDVALSSPGGAGSIIYELQLIRDRSVGGIGDFHTVRGDINPGDISVLVSGLSELYTCEWIMILGMDPIVPRSRLLHVRSPANERPAIRQKGHTIRLYVCIFVSNSIEPEILNYQILSSVPSRTTHIPSTRRELSAAASSSIVMISIREIE